MAGSTELCGQLFVAVSDGLVERTWAASFTALELVTRLDGCVSIFGHIYLRSWRRLLFNKWRAYYTGQQTYAAVYVCPWFEKAQSI